MVLSGKVVDTHALLQTVWVGLVAGVGLSGSYGLAMRPRAVGAVRESR